MSIAPAEYELSFWGDCLSTFEEERKHFVYAQFMGLGSFHAFGAEVVDVGAGPVSMLLKFSDRGASAVVDPLLDDFPEWVRGRYEASGISVHAQRGEDMTLAGYDEAWIYNVLQHVDDPEAVVANARKAARTVRLFEWVGIAAYAGHPHELTAADLSRWLGGKGAVHELARDGCYGTAFSGVFA